MLQQELMELIEKNKNAEVLRIDAYKLKSSKSRQTGDNFYFCGAVHDLSGHIIGIPNKHAQVLEIDPVALKIEEWGDLQVGNCKGWTGGALVETGEVYGFPRGANAYLKIDTRKRTIEQIALFKKYDGEHHYGGALSDEGVIYQPPRGGDDVLSYDTVTGKSKALKVKSIHKNKLLYYGATKDLNDNIYFYPAGKFRRVLVVDAKNKKTTFMKQWLYKPFFNSGTLAPNGDIYGFASYGKGVLHIDTKKSKARVIAKDFPGGCFGAKLGFNGKIYGIPGNTNDVVEFDPVKKCITRKIPLPALEYGQKAKCAGAAIDMDGNIWCVPAMGNYVYRIVFSGISYTPSKELYNSQYFNGTY